MKITTRELPQGLKPENRTSGRQTLAHLVGGALTNFKQFSTPKWRPSRPPTSAYRAAVSKEYLSRVTGPISELNFRPPIE